MNTENIKNLFLLMGNAYPIDREDWIMGSCPMSEWTHEKGRDERPSFGIRKATYSGFHCFACGAHGSLLSLPEIFKFKTGHEVHPDIKKLIQQTEGKWKEDDNVTKTLLALPNDILRTYSIPNSFGHIKFESINLWNLRYDKKENRMVIPIYDKHGRLVGIRGRSLDKEPRLKFRMYNELNPDSSDPKGSGVWLGMQFKLKPDKDLVLVEGDRDAILLKQVGVSNVWASLGASISKSQIDSIRNVPNRLVLFFDNDKAGMQATKKILDTCTGLMPIKIVKNYFGMKDPAELVENNLIRKVFA